MIAMVALGFFVLGGIAGVLVAALVIGGSRVQADPEDDRERERPKPTRRIWLGSPGRWPGD